MLHSVLITDSSTLWIYQFNTWAPNIAASQITVAEWDTFYSPQPPLATNFYLAMLSGDGKIYINSSNAVDKMHVINSPDSMGFACDVCQHCISLPTLNSFTMPNYFLEADVGSVCDTVTSLQTIKSDEIFFKIFPNPARDYFKINYENNVLNKNTDLFIYNLYGEIVFHQKLLPYSTATKVNCVGFLPGIYLISVTGENHNRNTARLVKIN